MADVVVSLDNLIGTAEAAEFLGISQGDLRKLSRRDAIPGQTKVAGRYVYDLEALQDFEVPETVSAGRATRRADGRIKYEIYLLPSEAEQLAEAGYDVVDKAAKREARRTAKAAVEAGEIEPKQAGETWYDVYERLEGEPVAATVEAESGPPAEAEDPFSNF